MNFPAITIATAIIFVLTYAGISLGRIPGFRLDRAGIALTGAALMMAVGAITPDEAYRAVNLDTLALLLGMMIVVAHLRLSGFFRLVTSWALEHAHSPLILLATIALTAGAFSAFLVNDAVCLVMAPLVIEVTRSLRRDPIPYLLAVAMASNVGSAATITGNPQNMIVGAISRIPYTEFATALAPVALAGIVLVFAVVAALWFHEFRQSTQLTAKPPPPRIHKPQLIKAVLVTLGVVAAFFAGVPVAMAAFLGGALLLVTRAISAQSLSRDRWLAPPHVCRSLRRRRGSRESSPKCGAGRRDAKLAFCQHLHPHRRYGGALKHHQQRARGFGAQTIRGWSCRSASHLARDCDERDIGWQSHPSRLRRQPHRCRTRPRRGHSHFTLDLLPRRNSTNPFNIGPRRVVAQLNPLPRSVA
jgi:hypothetical protein